jgi:formate dehydrogenase major subunit
MTTLNGTPVTPQGTWLETCRAAGVDVPTLCHDERVGPGGHCRACLIEVQGEFVPACTTPAREGENAVTDSAELREYRRDLGELLLAESDPAGDAARRIAAWGADGTRYAKKPRAGRRDDTHALVRFEGDRCILCRICVRVCEEVEGQFVFAIEGRGNAAKLAWGGVPFAQTDCSSCGECLTACPSGALTAATR